MSVQYRHGARVDTRLIRVALTFALVFGLLQTAVWYLGYKGFVDPILVATAEVTGALANLTGVPATVTANQVFLATRVLRIDLDCTGSSLVLIYSALVIAYPLGAKRKAVGLLVGVPALLIANLIRLTAVAQLSGRLDGTAFSFVHDYLFMVVMMTVVIVLWTEYLDAARRHAVKD